MQNYPLLTACAKTGKPIMLKRGYGASLRDWLGAAEYILVEGNEKVILCERAPLDGFNPIIAAYLSK
jgi:3-deoxy-D-arabino-heptulosonate 7-phosphate (DAHP) synthase